MWRRRRPFVCMPVQRLEFERFGMPGLDLVMVFVRVFEMVLGYNERLSRINLYATVHPRPIPRTSSQKET